MKCKGRLDRCLG